MLRTDAVIPHQVYEEAVTKGEEKGFADATVIRRFLEKYQIQVAAISLTRIETPWEDLFGNALR